MRLPLKVMSDQEALLERLNTELQILTGLYGRKGPTAVVLRETEAHLADPTIDEAARIGYGIKRRNLIYLEGLQRRILAAEEQLLG